MGVVFAILGVLGYAVTLLAWNGATTALHEIECGIAGLVSTVFFVGGAILSQLAQVQKAIAGRS